MFGHELRRQVGLIGPCVTDGDIGLPPHQVGHGERHDDLDAQRRRLLADLREDRGQKLRRVEMGGGDRDNARDLLALAAGGARGGMGGLGHGAEMLDQRQARVGQFHALARAGEEADAQLLLQRRHLPPERRLRQAERAGGGGKRAGLGRHHGGAGAVPVEGGVLSNPCENVWYSANSEFFGPSRMDIPSSTEDGNRWSER
jgi:hypothetical protein